MNPDKPSLPAAVVGTAGHIDHGKSALVRALTGIDPDRLPEEKKRGITIELGYAYLDLPSGRRVSIVDVPGHERFVKTMAQGASVVQIGLFVVDANEGVKPQTVEHLHILRSMGVRRGLIVMTKCDTAPEDLQELAEQEVRELVGGTFLEGAAAVRTSAVTGLGLEALKAHLDALAAEVGSDARRLPVRIPVDRVFSVAGFGTVVTGTLLGGRLRAGAEIVVYPSGATVKVRGIEVHDAAVEEAQAPCRIALNLGGVEANPAIRGKWLAAPGFFRETRTLLARVEGMPWLKREIRVPARLSANIGSGVFACRLLGSGGIRAGARLVARLAFDEPVIARTMDRFVLRLPGGMAGGYSTVAGGLVLDPLHAGRADERRLEIYGRIEELTDEELLLLAVASSGRRGIEEGDAMLKTAGAPADVEKAIGRLAGAGRIVRARGGLIADAGVFGQVQAEAAAALEAFHAARPEAEGLRRDELLRSLKPPAPRRLFDAVVEGMARRGAWQVSGDVVRIAGFSPRSDEITGRVSKKILDIIGKDPSSPPSIKELPALAGESLDSVQRAARLLAAEGRAKLIDGEFIYTAEFLDRFVKGVQAFFEKNEELRVTDLKAIAGVSRKYAIPLARWLDDQAVTLRRGEVRVRRKA